MTDICVTVPRNIWWQWIAEGDLPGDEPSGARSFFFLGGPIPKIKPGERVYIAAHGRIRGYAPLTELVYPLDASQEFWWPTAKYALVREGGAVAVTIPEVVRGFRGFRYVWWDEEEEVPFPDWQTAGVKR